MKRLLAWLFGNRRRRRGIVYYYAQPAKEWRLI